MSTIEYLGTSFFHIKWANVRVKTVMNVYFFLYETGVRKTQII